MLEISNPEGVAPPVGPYSHVAIVDPGSRLAFIAGQVAADPSGQLVGVGDFRAQFEAAFANLGRVLESLGTSFDDVAFVRGYLSRADDLPAYREERERLYASVCTGAAPPTTTLVVGALYHPDCLLEVDAVAVLPAAPA
jgi:enamine deaminase RidA (YjgF/YER057c/UK114 family)